MTDFTEFNPENIEQLVDALTGEAQQLGNQWWETNKSIIPGYLKSLAEATMQTEIALAQGLIDRDTADHIFRMQQSAFRQTIKFTNYMSLALSQKLVDTDFTMIGWAMYNKVGINFFPEYVSPE